MKILIYIVLLVSPLWIMKNAPHYESRVKAVIGAIFFWICQINFMSYYMKFDLGKVRLDNQSISLLLLPLLLDIFFMTHDWSAPNNGS